MLKVSSPTLVFLLDALCDKLMQLQCESGWSDSNTSITPFFFQMWETATAAAWAQTWSANLLLVSQLMFLQTRQHLWDPSLCMRAGVCLCVRARESNPPVKCRWEKRCWIKCVSAEKSRSCSLSTLMRTAVLTCSRPLRLEQNDSTSPGQKNEAQIIFINIYVCRFRSHGANKFQKYNGRWWQVFRQRYVHFWGPSDSWRQDGESTKTTPLSAFHQVTTGAVAQLITLLHKLQARDFCNQCSFVCSRSIRWHVSEHLRRFDYKHLLWLLLKWEGGGLKHKKHCRSRGRKHLVQAQRMWRTKTWCSQLYKRQEMTPISIL